MEQSKREAFYFRYLLQQHLSGRLDKEDPRMSVVISQALDDVREKCMEALMPDPAQSNQGKGKR